VGESDPIRAAAEGGGLGGGVGVLWRLAFGMGDGEGVFGLFYPAAVIFDVKYGDGKEEQG
jgi:hypothetical protein